MTNMAKPGTTTYTTPSDREILVARIVDAPRRIVFDAWTNPKHVPKWLLGPDGWTMPVCEIDLRPGGAWRYVWRKSDDGSELEMQGTFREVVAPERVVHTERWGPAFPETLNTIVFIESKGMTTILLTMTYATKEARDAALQSGMTTGMDRSFERLDAILGALV